MRDTDDHKGICNLICEAATEVERRKSSEKFKALFDNSADAIFIHTSNGRIQDANIEASRKYGYSREELLRLNISDIDDEKQQVQIDERLSTVKKNGSFVFESIHRTKSGALFSVEIAASLVDFDGENLFIATCRDISDRKHVEAALVKAEAKHRILLEESSDSIFELTEEGRYSYVNRAFSEGVGKPIGEIIGHTLWDVFTPEEADSRFARLSRALKSGSVEVLEVRIPSKDGDRYFMTTVSPIKGAKGDFPSAICSSKDISRLKQTEHKLREMAKTLEDQKHELEQVNESLEQRVIERTAEVQKFNTRFTRLAEHSRTVIWEVNAEGLYTYISNMSEALYGFPPAEVIGRRYFYDMLPVSERESVMETAFAVFDRKGSFVNFEHGSVRNDSDRQKIWVSTNGIPVLDDDGTLLGYSGTDTDISETRKLQDQLNHAQRLESVGRLAGGIAHDFNNKLSVIMGFAELARQQLPNTVNFVEYMEEITRAAEFSREITTQLLTFSRQQIISPRIVDLNSIINETLKSLIRLVGEQIKLDFQPCSDLWSVRIDPVQVDQIIMNLAVNARDAMPQGGTLSIATRNHQLSEDGSAVHCPQGEYVMISVNDTGFGMDEGTLRHIFEPFFTTKDVGKGTGLGLSTIHGIVSQNNGFLEVESEPGCGTTFRIHLPAFQ